MRYLHVEEALGLSSSIKKYESPRITAVSSRVVSTKSMATMVRGIFSKPRAQISNSFHEKSEVQRPLGSTGYTKPQNLEIAKNTEQSKKIVQLSKDIALWDIMLIHQWNGVVKNGTFDILGSFEFVPRMLNSYILAHPSSIVRCKVYKFSGHLHDTVKSELDRHGNIWESLFNNHIPSKEDIGLYFFASEKERKSTDVRLSAIAVGTANRGGLAKLSIQGTNICRGVTDICLKDISRGCHLNWIRENNNNESSRPLP